MDEVLREFILETQENLAQLDADLLTLERQPTDAPTLARVFRTLHSVKGTAGFIGLAKLQAVAHSGESLLAKLRAGERTFDRPTATALLGVVDAVRQVLAAVEANGGEGTGDYTSLIADLDRLRDGSAVLPPVVVSPRSLVIESPRSMAGEPPPDARGIADTALRVDVGLLDKLMTLVGELVLARNQIVQFSTTQSHAGFLGTVQRLNLLTTELQAGVMKTRMQPIANVWGKFPRVVRDLAVACGKQARLDMDGHETELDKTIVEAIRDPLTHMVRNAVDHGIESPAARAAVGKPAEGRLRLTAAHEGGKVVIELADDGGGIDPQKVRDKAVRNQLISAADAAALSDREAVDLIFLPGFSTTEQVTQFSGRGVGMDVVRTNVERIGGAVDVDSRPGQGTTVRMKIPLTLAIIPALTVTAGGERFCIPQVSLLELVRLDGDAARGVEDFHGVPVHRLRGALLPLVYLDEQLGLSDRREGVIVVVLQAGDRPFGLVVDAVHDTEEIVVKPLQQQVKSVSSFSGATILGDGRVALILDVTGVAERANVSAGVRGRMGDVLADAKEVTPREPLLLFSTADGGRMALPLPLVNRLEEFPASAVETVGPRRVAQYRDEILPLVDVASELRRLAHPGHEFDDPLPLPDPAQVVVTVAGGRRVGLVVSSILDIADDDTTARTDTTRPGVRYTAVVQGRVTEFLDVDGVAGEPRQ